MTERVGINPMLQSDAGDHGEIAGSVVDRCAALRGSKKDFSQSAVLKMADTGDIAKPAGFDVWSVWARRLGSRSRVTLGQVSVTGCLPNRKVLTFLQGAHIWDMSILRFLSILHPTAGQGPHPSTGAFTPFGHPLGLDTQTILGSPDSCPPQTGRFGLVLYVLDGHCPIGEQILKPLGGFLSCAAVYPPLSVAASFVGRLRHGLSVPNDARDQNIGAVTDQALLQSEGQAVIRPREIVFHRNEKPALLVVWVFCDHEGRTNRRRESAASGYAINSGADPRLIPVRDRHDGNVMPSGHFGDQAKHAAHIRIRWVSTPPR